MEPRATPGPYTDPSLFVTAEIVLKGIDRMKDESVENYITLYIILHKVTNKSTS